MKGPRAKTTELQSVSPGLRLVAMLSMVFIGSVKSPLVRLLYGIISLESTDRPAHPLLFCSYKEKSERIVAIMGD